MGERSLSDVTVAGSLFFTTAGVLRACVRRRRVNLLLVRFYMKLSPLPASQVLAHARAHTRTHTRTHTRGKGGGGRGRVFLKKL